MHREKLPGRWIACFAGLIFAALLDIFLIAFDIALPVWGRLMVYFGAGMVIALFLFIFYKDQL